MQPFPLRGPGFVYAGAISPGRDGFSRSQAGSGDCWGVAVGAGAAFATQGNGANRGEPAQLHADVGRGCLWGAEGRVLPVLCPGAPLLCHLRVPASCVPTYRCSPCGSSTTVAPVLPSPSPLPCAGAEGVQSILGSAGRFWGKNQGAASSLHPRHPGPGLCSASERGAGRCQGCSCWLLVHFLLHQELVGPTEGKPPKSSPFLKGFGTQGRLFLEESWRGFRVNWFLFATSPYLIRSCWLPPAWHRMGTASSFRHPWGRREVRVAWLWVAGVRDCW